MIPARRWTGLAVNRATGASLAVGAGVVAAHRHTTQAVRWAGLARLSSRAHGVAANRSARPAVQYLRAAVRDLPAWNHCAGARGGDAGISAALVRPRPSTRQGLRALPAGDDSAAPVRCLAAPKVRGFARDGRAVVAARLLHLRVRRGAGVRTQRICGARTRSDVCSDHGGKKTQHAGNSSSIRPRTTAAPSGRGEAPYAQPRWWFAWIAGRALPSTLPCASRRRPKTYPSRFDAAKKASVLAGTLCA